MHTQKFKKLSALVWCFSSTVSYTWNFLWFLTARTEKIYAWRTVSELTDCEQETCSWCWHVSCSHCETFVTSSVHCCSSWDAGSAIVNVLDAVVRDKTAVLMNTQLNQSGRCVDLQAGSASCAMSPQNMYMSTTHVPVLM